MPTSSAAPGPTSRRACSKSRRAEATATRLTASNRRSFIGGTNAAASKPRIVAARCERHADVSNAVIAEIPEAPDATASASAAWPSPNEEMHPMPVMTTRSRTVSWPDRGEREAIDIRQTQKRIDQYFAHASLDALRSMFEIVVEPDAAVRGADRVDLRPKRKPIKAGLERLQLWIDRESLLLVQMQMPFPGGGTKSIRLAVVTLRVPVTDEMFQIR